MTRAAHIQPPPAWPTTPDISRTDRTAPLLLEENGLGDEVDATKNGLGDEVERSIECVVECGGGGSVLSIAGNRLWIITDF
jgi:hypothetical protein